MSLVAEFTSFPDFKAIVPEEIESKITALIESNLSAIEKLLIQKGPYTWENLIVPLESIEDKLSQTWSPIHHLNSVCNAPVLRQAHQNCLSKLSDYATKIGQNPKLYEAFQNIKASQQFKMLNKPQQKVIQDALRDFALSGVALPQAERLEFSKVKQKLSQLQSQFENNVLDASDGWFLDITDLDMLQGVPEHALKSAQEKAKLANVSGYRFGLDFPSYFAIITYADNNTKTACAWQHI